MKHSIAIAWLITILGFIFFWPIGIIGLCVSLYITFKNGLSHRSSKQAKELEHQREMEHKELDIVRKSNEVLLHLMQDEHREGR